MNKEEIRDKVYSIIKNDFGISKETINLTDNLIEDLEFDELDTITLVLDLEEAFETEIPDEVAERFITVKDILDYIIGKVSNG